MYIVKTVSFSDVPFLQCLHTADAHQETGQDQAAWGVCGGGGELLVIIEDMSEGRIEE